LFFIVSVQSIEHLLDLGLDSHQCADHGFVALDGKFCGLTPPPHVSILVPPQSSSKMSVQAAAGSAA
jgi:hypothetical protein